MKTIVVSLQVKIQIPHLGDESLQIFRVDKLSEKLKWVRRENRDMEDKIQQLESAVEIMKAGAIQGQ